MSDEIKVPPGYWASEVGVIPKEWEVKELGEICQTASGTTPPRSMRSRYYSNGTVHWVKTLDLNNSIISCTTELVTNYALQETGLRAYPIGTVLVAMYGGFNQIGRTGLLEIPAAVNQAITAIIANDAVLCPRYLIALLNFRVESWKNVASSSRKDPNITRKDVSNFLLPLPPLPEQKAIASALRDVDDCLDAQSALVAKKRDLKTAALGELLTPKRRLPRFSGEWEEKTLGDILEQVKGGGTPSRSIAKFWNGSIPWVTVKDFATFNPYSAQETITEEGLRFSASNLIPAGILIISTRMAVGKAMIYQVPVSINQDLKALFLRPNYDSRFLFYWFAWKIVELDLLASGSTVKGISLGELKGFDIKLPPTITEQKAIAEVLSDMDAEIAALEAERDKTRQLKSAMMDELLSGRTRLL